MKGCGIKISSGITIIIDLRPLPSLVILISEFKSLWLNIDIEKYKTILGRGGLATRYACAKIGWSRKITF